MLQLNHLMLKSNSLEQTSEGLQTRNSFSSGYQSYMHNPHLFPTEPKKPITLVKEHYMPFSPICIVPVMKLFESSPTGDNLMLKSLNDDVK